MTKAQLRALHKADAWAAAKRTAPSADVTSRPIPRRDPAPADLPAGPTKKPAKSARETPLNLPAPTSGRDLPPPNPAPLEQADPWPTKAAEIAKQHADRWPPCACGACRFMLFNEPKLDEQHIYDAVTFGFDEWAQHEDGPADDAEIERFLASHDALGFDLTEAREILREYMEACTNGGDYYALALEHEKTDPRCACKACRFTRGERIV